MCYHNEVMYLIVLWEAFLLSAMEFCCSYSQIELKMDFFKIKHTEFWLVVGFICTLLLLCPNFAADTGARRKRNVFTGVWIFLLGLFSAFAYRRRSSEYSHYEARGFCLISQPKVPPYGRIGLFIWTWINDTRKNSIGLSELLPRHYDWLFAAFLLTFSFLCYFPAIVRIFYFRYSTLFYSDYNLLNQVFVMLLAHIFL